MVTVTVIETNTCCPQRRQQAQTPQNSAYLHSPSPQILGDCPPIVLTNHQPPSLCRGRSRRRLPWARRDIPGDSVFGGITIHSQQPPGIPNFPD